ncbi:MAG: hypothetical protein H6772_03000 [Pseudomonadales bacterium]|nr:hypothetical protein [Pseudomonadales bacterium]
MPKSAEEKSKKENFQGSVTQLDFIYAPVPEGENASLDSVEEYDQKKANKIRERMNQGIAHQSNKVPFVESDEKTKKEELFAKLESGELPQRKVRRIYSLVKLHFMGIANPKEFLKLCFDQPTTIFIEEEDRESNHDTVVGYNYDRAVYLGGELAELFEDPVTFLRRSSAIGLVYTMISNESKFNPDFMNLCKSLMEMPEDKFTAAAKSMQQLTWLDTSYSFQDDFSAEFSARLQYLEKFPNFSTEDQAAFQGQVVLEGICGSPVERLSQVMGNNAEIQALVVIAKEFFMNRDKGNDNIVNYQDREKLKKLWNKKSILLDLTNRILEGRRISPQDRNINKLSYSYLDSEQEAQLEEQIGVSLTPDQQKIANILDLHTLETTQLVVRIDALVQKTLLLNVSFNVRQETISKLNDTAPHKSFYGIKDIFEQDESSDMFQEWIQLDKDLEESGRIRKTGDEHNFMDVFERRLAFKRVLSRTMLMSEGGEVDTKLVRLLAGKAKDVSMNGYLDEHTKKMLPEVGRKLVHLIDQLDVNTSPSLLNFILENIDQVAQHVDDDFKINENFILLFFSSDHAISNNLHNEIANMLENSGIADGYVKYLNKILPVLRLSRIPLTDHYNPIFLIFSNSQSDKDRNTKILEYWSKNNYSLFVLSLSKELLIEYFGVDRAEAFLSALPKKTDERRNAFLHNDYDRTSQWLVEMQKQTASQRYGSPYLDEVTFNFSNDIEIASAFIKRFGLAKNPFLFEIFKVLKVKEADETFELPEKITDLGLKSLSDLYTEYDQAQRYLLSTEALIEAESLTEFQKVLLSSVTGRDTHSFIRSDSMQNIIDRFHNDVLSGEIAPLGREYVVERISLLDVEISYKPSELVQQKFNLILEMVGTILEKPNVEHWQLVVEDFKVMLAEKVRILKQKLEKIQADKAGFINEQLEQIATEVIKVDQIQSIDDALQIIGMFDPDKQQSEQWEVLVQRLVFSRILNNGPLRDKYQNLAAVTELNPKALLTTINVYDELIKHHAINFGSEESSPYWSVKTREFFSNTKRKKQLKRLKGIFAGVVGVLKEDIPNIEKTDLNSQRSVDMIPDKGLIGEMSGYVANACYTFEQSMLRNWKVTPYKFIDTAKEPAELVGTGLVFQVQLKSGEKALLVRAINIPNEGAYDMEIFCEKFINAIAEVGRRTGNKKILVPGISGAMSNYQMTIKHLTSTYCEDKDPVSLSEIFAFNGYDLTHNSYVAREL